MTPHYLYMLQGTFPKDWDGLCNKTIEIRKLPLIENYHPICRLYSKVSRGPNNVFLAKRKKKKSFLLTQDSIQDYVLHFVMCL